MNEQVRIPGTSVTVAQKAPMAAGGAVTAFIPQTLDEVWRFAEIVTASGFAPPGLKTSQAVMVAIMHGAEVGLSPFASIKNIAVINNRPVLWGDMVSGVVRASGKCEYIKETISGDGDTLVATCEVKRKGEPAETRTFSAADAKRAGVWSKAGPWTQYPKRMLAVRARSFALRDVFPDVLGGLDIREEVEDSNDMIDVTPPSPSAEAPEPEQAAPIARTRRSTKRESPPPAAAAVEEPAAGASPPAPSPDEEEEQAQQVEDAHFEEAPQIEPEEVLANFTEALAQITDKQGAGEVWDSFDGQIRSLGPQFTARCSEVYKARIEELQGETADERKARLRPAYDAGIVAFYAGRKKTIGPREKEFKEGDYLKAWAKGWDNADAGQEPNPDSPVPPSADDFPGDTPAVRLPPSEADLETAYQAGRAAREKGMSPRALPGEYRSDDRVAEAAAWREGWNDAAPAAD